MHNFTIPLQVSKSQLLMTQPYTNFTYRFAVFLFIKRAAIVSLLAAYNSV